MLLHGRVQRLLQVLVTMGITKTMTCLVPGCDKHWFLEGPRQGFAMAAVRSHAMAHWTRYHYENKHEGPNYEFCKVCHPKGDRKIIGERRHS